ncbi:HhoA/HhoB/HtrA family serine endopeptidase [Leptothoe sp. PORK10 BA2]|uniref:HhoA/HhoB/HtrA family serine endopeptidase n=1 Tax=Leptothoe sp. PORK10 BA2 TaxID=3110254 RepID=UPI002B204A05|nr:HhoA/HhoB/HtrA family serine endopeptidase [Leptothoe sp. PORK10 BA2]MEA5465653.1 HhoA/HhoB/HtrA family serine endopeptidase [Leptothoe sp. PORK10 BA2]
MSYPLHPKPANPRARSISALGSLVIGAGLATAGGFLAWSPVSPLRSENRIAVAQTAPTPTISLAANPNFITDVVTKVGPAVVRIDASRTVSQQVPDIFNDPGFRQFFGERLPQGGQERTEQGLGSGFIISEDGRIITNAHVVEGADTVTVTLKDGRILDGQVLGSDPVTDIAVIKVEDEQDLPTVALGDSDQLQPGEWSIAIGNPLGLDNTVTVGIISAVGRSSNQVGVPDKRVEFIQTDTAINPGNSGGPLLNQQGEVIGVNTAIISGAQGLGFSIPINMVERIATELAETGKVEHPFLGIQMVTLSPAVKEEINSNPNSGLTVEAETGILIVQVLQGSPAAKGGLRAGDVIKTMDGTPVADAEAVQRVVGQGKVGQKLTFEVERNGELKRVDVKPENIPQ